MTRKNIITNLLIGASAAVVGYFSRDVVNGYKAASKKYSNDFIDNVDEISKFRDTVNNAINQSNQINIMIDNFRTKAESRKRSVENNKDLIFGEAKGIIDQKVEDTYKSFFQVYDEAESIIDAMESCSTIICIASSTQKIKEYASSEFEVFIKTNVFTGIVNRGNCTEVFRTLYDRIKVLDVQMDDYYCSIAESISEYYIVKETRNIYDQEDESTEEKGKSEETDEGEENENTENEEEEATDETHTGES